jgi:hypothetical protein
MQSRVWCQVDIEERTLTTSLCCRDGLWEDQLGVLEYVEYRSLDGRRALAARF